MKASIKERELREVVGKEVSFNLSPTLRAKLVKVNRKTAVMEVVSRFPIAYNRSTSKYIKAPIDTVWNAYFF
jgi:hypothetical protein